MPKVGPFRGIAMIIDGTEFPVRAPPTKDLSKLLCSGRKKSNQQSRHNLKYSLGVQISTGRIVWLEGPDPGSMTDIASFRLTKLFNITKLWDDDERILADKGYIGEDIFVTPIKESPHEGLSPEEEVWNDTVANIRQLVECTIRRIKIFGILGSLGKFRHCLNDHSTIVNVCAQITNISLERDPVWPGIAYYLGLSGANNQ